MRKLLGMDQALDRLVERNAGRDEDRQHNGVPGPSLSALASQEEGNADRYRGEGVTGVVDQVGEERHRAGKDEDDGLHGRCYAEHAETDENGLDSGSGADDRAVDQTMRVTLFVLARSENGGSAMCPRVVTHA
jgi:hypothetical protein